MHTSTIKFLISGHDLKFLTPLIQRLETTSGYTVRVLRDKGHHIDSPGAAQEALDWADVIFCEWALGNAVWFSERKRPDQVLIVRLHLQEVQARDRIDFIWRTDWERVDRLILITQHVYDWMLAEFPVLTGRVALVYNPIPARTTFALPKSVESRFTLGLVGVVPSRKRLDLAVAILRHLRTLDDRYTLRVKGSLPSDYPWMANRTEEMAWYNRVFEDQSDLRSAGAVIFDPHGPDMAKWYQGIGHILSVSDFEGSHQAVAEGMATGCVPAIRDWEGAGQIYPPKYIAGSVEALAELIHRNTNTEAFLAHSDYSRHFAQERFDNEPTCSTLEGIIAQEIRRVRRDRVESRLLKAARRTPNFLIVAYIPEGSRSGYRIRVEQEIQALTQQGCKVHLACLLPKPQSTQTSDELHAHRTAHAADLARMGCIPHLVEIEDFFRIKTNTESFPEVTAFLARIVDQHDIDIAHAEALYCARVAVAVKSARPFVCFSIDWHGIVPEESRMGGAHEARVRALDEAEQTLLAASDLNIFVSETMGEHYRIKYGNPSKSHVIVPCCVSDQRFVDIEDRSKLSAYPEETLVFGYAGSMADWQCGEEMIALFAALHRVDERCRFKLLVPKTDQNKVTRYCSTEGLAEHAYLMYEVPHEQVPKNLLDCDVGVLLRRPDPVNYVSSPTKFGEYLAAGLPVLMTDAIGDYSQLADRMDVGYVIPSDVIFDSSQATADPEMLRKIISFVERCKSSRPFDATRYQTVAREALHWEPVARNWIASYLW